MNGKKSPKRIRNRCDGKQERHRKGGAGAERNMRRKLGTESHKQRSGMEQCVSGGAERREDRQAYVYFAGLRNPGAFGPGCAVEGSSLLQRHSHDHKWKKEELGRNSQTLKTTETKFSYLSLETQVFLLPLRQTHTHQVFE
ncbi:hypothetical protein DNTS_014975, partial [Danionella cerebrum]